MLDIRKRLFIILGLGAGLILVVILIIMFASKSPDGEKDITVDTFVPQQVINTDSDDAKSDVIVPPDVTSPSVVEDENELYARQTARLFVERFLSYSNQNSNKHIEDVLPLATARMKQWIASQEVDEGTAYEGVTTKVIASSIKSISSNQAIVNFGVQQTIQTITKKDIKTRDGQLYLLRSGSDWKVDGLFWDR